MDKKLVFRCIKKVSILKQLLYNLIGEIDFQVSADDVPDVHLSNDGPLEDVEEHLDEQGNGGEGGNEVSHVY